MLLTRAPYQRSARALGALGSVAALATAVLAAWALDDLARHRFPAGLGLLLTTVLARWILASALDEWSAFTAQRLRARWRHAIVHQLADPRREGERARGDLALAIDQAADAPGLERLRASAASSLLGLVIIFLAAGWLPLVITVALLGLAAPLYVRAGERSEVAARGYQERRATLESRQLEILQHAPELRALGAVNFGANEIGAISDSEHTLAMRAVRVALESSLVTEFLSGVSIGLVAMVVGFGLLGGRISLLRALVAVLIVSELFVQVRRFGVEFHRRDDAERALDALDVGHSSRSSLSGDVLVSAKALVTEANDDEINLDLRAGDRLAVSGPSGVGKTTLLHTLLGWRSARSGVTERTSRPVGYVSAESALFSGSLRENLALGTAIPDEDLVSCLRSLGLVGERFNDLDATLSADGRGLSAGERVRLVLARSLLAGPAVLLVDDVAGLLDSVARACVRDVLREIDDVAVIEASVDTSLLSEGMAHLELRR